MKETVRSAPRLQFTDEELIAEGLKKPIEHVQKATKKATKARQKLSGKMIFDKNTAAEQHAVTDQPVTASKSEKLMLARTVPATATASALLGAFSIIPISPMKLPLSRTAISCSLSVP